MNEENKVIKAFARRAGQSLGLVVVALTVVALGAAALKGFIIVIDWAFTW